MGQGLIAASAILSVFQGFQAYQQGKAQAKAATQAAEYNARAVANQTEVDRRQMQRQQSAFMASQRVRAAGSGATIASFEDTFEEDKEQSLLDVALLDYDSKIQQQNIRYQGQQQAYSARDKGRQGLISGLGSAAATASKGFTGGMGGVSSRPTQQFSPSGQVLPGFKPTRY